MSAKLILADKNVVQTYFELASLNLDKKWWFFSMINSTENHKRNQCSQLVLEMVTESENRQNRADNILLEKTWEVIFWSISLHFTFVSSFFPYQTHHSMYIFWSPNMFLNISTLIFITQKFCNNCFVIALMNLFPIINHNTISLQNWNTVILVIWYLDYYYRVQDYNTTNIHLKSIFKTMELFLQFF